MVFNATFNNIFSYIVVVSFIVGRNRSTQRKLSTCCKSVLLVEETWVARENYRPVTSHWQTLSHNDVLGMLLHERDSNSHIQWWQISQVVVNPTTIQSRVRRPLWIIGLLRSSDIILYSYFQAQLFFNIYNLQS
jgi:hypothetical protein